MPEVIVEKKIATVKKLFPNPVYTMLQIAEVFGHRNKKGKLTTKIVKYWFLVYSVPTFKVTGTPFVLQENLINMFLLADKKKSKDDNLCGLEHVIEDAERCPTYKK